MRPSRRALLIGGPIAALGLAGGATVAGIETGVLPGRQRLTETVEGCGTDGRPPAGPAGTVVRQTFHSTARGRDVATVVIRPPGFEVGRALPVCLVLHGKGGTAAESLTGMSLDRYLAAAVRGGVAPFAFAAVDGGGTYWHRRTDGDDPEAMILDELLPRLRATGLVTSRLGALGWSMGGYGAVLLAHRHPRVFVAAAASSPAVWNSYADSAPGAFDSSADFDNHRVLGVGPAPGVAYRIDCGHADPFYGTAQTLVRQLRPAQHSFRAGCHTFGYWRSAAPAQIAFVGRVLAT